MSSTLVQFPEGTPIGVWQIASLLLIVAVIFFAIIIFKWGWLWIQALFSGAPVNLFSLVGMSIRRVPASMIVNSYINLVKAGINQPISELEKHYLAGGNVPKTVRAVIEASNAGLPLTLQRAMAIDLTGRDILDAVQTSVTPRVIDCPDPRKGKETIDAVAKDGIQLKVKARVTVRTNLERLVGGATEETIIARVGEGIVTTIGSSEVYKQVLENPDRISKTVLEKGLDAGTAFEILSIDIADIDVGVNVGAELQAAQAEADMRVARAKAEERRALAVAKEQEMIALTQENRAKVVLAEAEIPLAIATAFKEGKLGIFDYYHLKNLQADTSMREAIGEIQQPKTRHHSQEERKEN